MDGFLLFVNHPYDGLRYKSCHDSLEAAKAACVWDTNVAHPPETYEFVVIEGYVRAKGPPTEEEEAEAKSRK